MSRLVRLLAVVALATNLAGCCRTPYRAWQDYVGWNNPLPDRYGGGPPPPRTTPPGNSTPATEPYPASVTGSDSD